MRMVMADFGVAGRGDGVSTRQVEAERCKPLTPMFRTGSLLLVKSILEQNAMTVEIGPESRLVDVGLTSMDMVNLMLGVEAEFDFTIPQSEITPENFQSVETLAADDRQPARAGDGGLIPRFVSRRLLRDEIRGLTGI